MRLTYYANACCVMEAEGFRMLTDPWLVDGAFEGSWRHYPPLRTRPQDLADVDALFISHLHPDHCDPETLKAFRRDIPIVVLDHGPNFLHRVLEGMGFTNLVKIRHEESGEVGPFEVTLYAPFTGHLFHDSEVGNLIDCAAVFEAGGLTVMNFNDNTPDVDAAERLHARHGRPTVAQLAYNAAGPYPSCFDNLSWDKKADKSIQILERNFAHAADIARILKPKWHMPFAGSYVIGGRQWRKNHWLGTTSQDVAGDWLKERNRDIPVLLLNEGQSLDLKTGRRSHIEYQPIDRGQELAYIEGMLAHQPYPYEADPQPDEAELVDLCHVARARLWSRQDGFHFRPDLRVAIRIGEGAFVFDCRRPDGAFLPYAGASMAEPWISASMDPRLLKRILVGTAHWNNAEIGCHIDFVRQPDVYVRDLHTLMSFFSAGTTVAAAGRKVKAA